MPARALEEQRTSTAIADGRLDALETIEFLAKAFSLEMADRDVSDSAPRWPLWRTLLLGVALSAGIWILVAALIRLFA